MNIKAISVALVVVMVGAVVFGAVLPIFDDVTATEDTFTNDGAYYVEVDPTDTYTIEYDKSVNPGVVIINGTNMDIPFTSGYTILALDKSILRLQSGDSTLQYKGDGQYITGITNLDITISNGTVTGTCTYNQTEYDWPATSYTKAYVASNTTQDYVMTEYNTVSKMNGDSDIFAFGQTVVDTTIYLIKIVGNIDDGVTVSVLHRTTGEAVEGATVTNLSINAVAVSGYEDLYDLSSITFTVTLEDTSTTNATYSAYIVPTEVTAERSVHVTDSEGAIMDLIPLIIGFSLVLMTIGFFLRKKL